MIFSGPIKTIKDAAEAFEQVQGLGKLSTVDERFMETVLDKMRCCARMRTLTRLQIERALAIGENCRRIAGSGT